VQAARSADHHLGHDQRPEHLVPVRGEVGVPPGGIVRPQPKQVGCCWMAVVIVS
jgi:hypothetical protein